MRYITFELLYFLNLGRAYLIVFNIKKLFNKCKSPFATSEMNTPQAEENVNSCLYSRGRSSNKLHKEYEAGEESSTLFSNNEKETNVSFLLSMVELDHRRLVAKALVNKMGRALKF